MTRYDPSPYILNRNLFSSCRICVMLAGLCLLTLAHDRIPSTMNDLEEATHPRSKQTETLYMAPHGNI